jgi:mono/diheme cytochrome c family protein
MQSGRHVPSTTEKPATEQSAAKAPAEAAGLDVNQLFASTCGWCHLKGGREAGKGPQLMATKLTDAEIVSRIKNGKPGQMPAFGATFNDAQLAAIVTYIRELKP